MGRRWQGAVSAPSALAPLNGGFGRRILSVMQYRVFLSVFLSAVLLPGFLRAGVERVWLTHQSPDPSKLVVSWQTSEPGESTVEFGTSAAFGETATVAGSRTLHHVEIPLVHKDTVYHYRVKTGSQVSEAATFKGYPTETLRIAVIANLRADAKIDLSALKKDDVHLLLSAGDTAMQYQFCGENLPDCTKSHGTAIDTQADLFRSTPFLPTLGNLDRKIRPSSEGPQKPAYDIPATAYRAFFALPGAEWHWTFSIPDFDLQLVSVDMNHTGDFGTPDQSCHPFGADSEQLLWYRGVMEAAKAGQVVTLYGETGGRVRSHAGGEWKRLIEMGTLAISGEAYHAERVVEGRVTYLNASVRGNGTFGIDPNPAFIDKSAGYILLTVDRASGRMTAALKALDGRVLDQQTIDRKAR